MSAAARLTQFLVDITRGPAQPAFRADPEATIAASRLDERLRDALRTQDVATLWRAGAHPMALLYFARASGWDNARYYACVEAADLTPAASAAAGREGLDEPTRTRPPTAPHAR